jgi:hypothetical protein
LDRAADARIGSPPLESQGVLMDGSEREDGESLHIHIYYIAKRAGWVGASGRSGPRPWLLGAGRRLWPVGQMNG